MNQTQAVFSHLKAGKTLTSKEAFQLYGCTRLSAKVFNLRKKGYDIETIMCEGTNRYGETCRYGKYIYKGELKNED
jgi:hypothetical protein